jgi:prevent-host-death family protein
VKKASISEAKNALSALLDRVRNGQSITIEDRGVPVARLEPVVGTRGDQSGRAARLERQGIVRPPAAAFDKSLLRTRPPAARDDKRASDVLLAERRDER